MRERKHSWAINNNYLKSRDLVNTATLLIHTRPLLRYYYTQSATAAPAAATRRLSCPKQARPLRLALSTFYRASSAFLTTSPSPHHNTFHQHRASTNSTPPQICHLARVPPHYRALTASAPHQAAKALTQLLISITSAIHISATLPHPPTTITSNMSGQQGKLDQSLDEIMKDAKPARAGRGRAPRRAAVVKAAAATAAPAGGVAKKTRAPKGPKAVAAAAPAIPTTGDSKIIVSGLPEDVNESQIKDYFSKSVGAVKKVMLTYGPNGRSRGTATIIFSKPGSAEKAARELNGVKVDNRAMRIEVVVGAKSLSAAAAPKSLSDRVAKPKNAAQEKNKGAAAKGPKVANGAEGAAAKTGRNQQKKKSGRVGKPKAKTAEELDAEMQDYFGSGETNGAAPAAAPQAAPATNDDANMDEIS
ncbi:hypothetical protein Q7P37_007069 [Cladosporium fusiforme]